ncbi:MAG: beta-carotene 15,15'-dioxygenase, Brp/Blh family [Winogradskyella sp.]|uniref:Brp/Blh family beta-carotene 15,15'-dioxygenase n=1 Tax=Winogradskyella sp. TaxID=1883156 RepID=UPI0017BE188B|nr:Brp/Blh family beta-carotene 15,15'-dioxygenase [Winogradskyella sp.]MBT8243970.1 Brp/Blh family beta-carotene 15,15'-dioxygenase [Winogradskyella sp.]NNK22334.1 beta-carotene 15,15'-dioxygenase, Brp/Blh family [Winogradskyella sp.]
MRNIQNFNIVTTFLCLWIAVYLPENLEQYLACFFILSVGLLHGANDIKIIKKVYSSKNLSFYKTLLLYVFVVLLGTLMFYFVPSLTLLSFVLISGYHFGEQHFHNIKSDIVFIKQVLFISYGCSVIFLMLHANSEESITIISQITSLNIGSNLFLYGLIVSCTLFMICFTYLYNYIKSPVRELFNFTVFFIVFKTATLIWAFAIYFVIWHSLPSLLDQIKFLSKEVNKVSILSYVKSSFLYWLVSVVGLFLFFNFLIKESDLFYAVFFSFLASITFPHVIVMTKIFKH